MAACLQLACNAAPDYLESGQKNRLRTFILPETCGPNQGRSFFNHAAHLEQIGKYVYSRYEEDVLIWLQRGCGGGDTKGEGRAEALAHFGFLVVGFGHFLRQAIVV